MGAPHLSPPAVCVPLSLPLPPAAPWDSTDTACTRLVSKQLAGWPGRGMCRVQALMSQSQSRMAPVHGVCMAPVLLLNSCCSNVCVRGDRCR